MPILSYFHTLPFALAMPPFFSHYALLSCHFSEFTIFDQCPSHCGWVPYYLSSHALGLGWVLWQYPLAEMSLRDKKKGF